MELFNNLPSFSYETTENMSKLIREEQAAIKTLLEKKYPGVYKYTVGVVDALTELEEFIEESPKDNYPPHTIKYKSHINNFNVVSSGYEISMAVAGFSKDELKVEIYNNTIFVAGDPAQKNIVIGEEFVDAGVATLATERVTYSGIAARKFRREFLILESMTVNSVVLDSGTLTISIENHLGDRPVANLYEIVQVVSDIPTLYIDKTEPNPTKDYPNAEVVFVYCDECLKYHQHGMPEGNTGKYIPEHRVAHCSKRSSKYYKKGYNIAYKKIVSE